MKKGRKGERESDRERELYTHPVYLICELITLINIPLREGAGAFRLAAAFSIMRSDK